MPTRNLVSTLENHHSSGVYIKRDLELVNGSGAHLFDASGHRYIDMMSGQGATNLGHSHPAIVDAIQEQANTLINCPELVHNPIRARYQAKLCSVTNMDRVFLCNSGAEAIEAAIKFAIYTSGRIRIISTMRGFHGRTLGALSTTWNRHYRAPVADLLPKVDFVPYNNIDRLQQAISTDVAAIILEPIQGEGGVHPAEAGYLQAVRELCDEYGVLLILDEVQTGFGRTGNLFAYQYENITPDLLCLAKSIANGVPMGAVLLAESVGDLAPALHGSTFGGNPLACATALAVLNTLSDDQLIESTAQRGAKVINYLRDNLSPDIMRTVRGRGFMIGIELRTKVAPILSALQERGVIALPASATVLRLLPPLIISDEDLWQAVHIIEEVVNRAV